jgi:hypothetical protein
VIGEHGPVISNADDMVSKKHVNIVALLIACRISSIALGCKSVAVKCLIVVCCFIVASACGGGEPSERVSE